MTRAGMLAGIGAVTVAAPARALAQQNVPARRLAIVCEPIDNSPLTTEDMGRFESRLGGALLKTGRFSLVDRQRLDRIIREQGFSNSAYADPHTAARLGKLAGAERFLNVQLAAKTETDRGAFMLTVAYNVTADFNLVDTSTGTISASGSADGDAQDKEPATSGTVSSIALDALQRQAIDACIDDLVGQLTT
jgi:hypothetical protein